MVKRRLDYSKKKYQNPFFNRKKRRFSIANPKIISIKLKLYLLSFFGLVIILVWFFYSSQFFLVKNIEINGLRRISQKDIEEIILEQTKLNRFLIGRQSNILLFNKRSLINKLNSNYSFNSIEIDKVLPRSLILNIQEKDYAYIWQEDDKYYYADIDGYVMDEINPLEIEVKKFPIIHNQGGGKIEYYGNNKKINIDMKYTDFVDKLYQEFKDKEEGDLIIETFIIDDELNTLKMKILNGPTIIFNINEDFDKQINKLMIIKQEKLKEDFFDKIYINVKFGDRVYYR